MIISFPALLTRRELWEIIGRGEVEGGGGWWRRCKQPIKHMFLYLLQLVRGFLYEKYHLKKVWSSTEQTSDETVPKNCRRYLFANPDRCISIYIKKECIEMLVWDIQRCSNIYQGLYVVVQFYRWFKFYFLLFLGMVSV